MSQPIIIPAKNHHRHSLIWLHGLGDQGSSFISLVEDFGFENTQFILPSAPVRPITLNGGMMMPGWYDIESLDIGQRQDLEGVLASGAYVQGLIQAQIDLGISPENIILAGFSQGGAVALYAAATFAHQIGGIIATSTYLPIRDAFEERLSQKPPVIMCHGTADDIVTYEIGTRSRDALIELGFKLQWEEYPIPHSLCLEEMQAIKAWILKRWEQA